MLVSVISQIEVSVFLMSLKLNLICLKLILIAFLCLIRKKKKYWKVQT